MPAFSHVISLIWESIATRCTILQDKPIGRLHQAHATIFTCTIVFKGSRHSGPVKVSL